MSVIRPVARRLRGLAHQGLLSGLATGFAVLLLSRLPGLAGTSWLRVAGSLRSVSTVDLLLLAALWMAGLWCHSWVLTSALPGLSRGRALMLNLSGSAVCDLTPFGAVAGAGMNFAMIRSWRLAPATFTTLTIVSNLCNVLAKLALAAAVMVPLLVSGALRSPELVSLARGTLILLLIACLLTLVGIGSGRAAAVLGRGADRVAAALLRRIGSPQRTDLARALPLARSDVLAVIRRGWISLTLGMAGYLALQAVLWVACLAMLGARLPVAVVMVGFGAERVLSMVPLTPGGAGLAEAGSVAVLISLGGDPLTVTAAVLLFRVFAFLLEIPVGGASILAWLWWRRRERAA